MQDYEYFCTMKKKIVSLIIVITSLSLVGIIITQVFWVKNAVELKDEQFNHRIELGLKSVLNRMVAIDNRYSFNDSPCGMICGRVDSSLVGRFSPRLLDSLMQDEFSHLQLNQDYYYGIYSRGSGNLIFASSYLFHKELVESKLFISLSCLYSTECYVLGIYIPDQQSLAIQSMGVWLVVSVLFLIILVAGFAYSIFSLMKQKKLSEMKRDFVNNMTHEFKTPISTISLAGEMLSKPAVVASPEKVLRYGDIILNEINRLKNQVEQVLQIAVLDRGEYSLRKKEMDVHQELEGILKGFGMAVRKRDGYLISRLQATQSRIYADRDHFINVIHNLLDNAEKYSEDAPVITVQTEDADGGIRITVQDQGIGISEEAQKHIFRKLYRVPTGNIHNVKGQGLGLYYVKTIMEAHSGTITLHSEKRKGSTFVLFFPYGIKESESETNEEQVSKDPAG